MEAEQCDCSSDAAISEVVFVFDSKVDLWGFGLQAMVHIQHKDWLT